MSKYNFGRLSSLAILSASFIVGCGGRDAAEFTSFPAETPAPATTDRTFEAETFSNTGTETSETITSRRYTDLGVSLPHLGSNTIGIDFEVVTRTDQPVVTLDSSGEYIDVTLSAPTESLVITYGATEGGSLSVWQMSDGAVVADIGDMIIQDTTVREDFNYAFVNLNNGNGGSVGLQYRIILDEGDVSSVRIDEILETNAGSATLAQDLPLSLYRVYQLGDPDDTTLLTNGIAEFNGDPAGQAGQSQPEDGIIEPGAAFNITGVGDGVQFAIDANAAGATRVLLYYLIGPGGAEGSMMFNIVESATDDTIVAMEEFSVSINSNDWGSVIDGESPFSFLNLEAPLVEGQVASVEFGPNSGNLLRIEAFGPPRPQEINLGDANQARLQTNGVAEFNGDPAGQAGQDGNAAFNITGVGDGVSFVPLNDISARMELFYIIGPGGGEGNLSIFVGPADAAASSDDGVTQIGSFAVVPNSDDWGAVRDGGIPSAIFELGDMEITTDQRVFIEFGSASGNLLQVNVL